MSEWENQYNPFNSWKLMAHAPLWKSLSDRQASPPVTITIDPINACNFSCPYCNASKVTGSGHKIDQKLNAPLAKFLKDWGVKTVCVAGGGEPTLHPSIIKDLVDAGIRVGIVTNGSLMDRCPDLLSLCDWVGVSVDAATPKTFEKVKETNSFIKVIDNIELLATLMNPLKKKSSGYGIFYKYLILPGNEHEIAAAAKLARTLGCKGFHARPAGIAGVNVEVVKDQCNIAKTYGTNEFGVYTVTHKVGKNLAANNNFKKCWGCVMTCVITPHPKGFNIDLCCDQRDKYRLAEGLTEPSQILEVWNSKKHWKIHDSINPQKCPRCTYGPHAKLFENCIDTDNMTYDFI